MLLILQLIQTKLDRQTVVKNMTMDFLFDCAVEIVTKNGRPFKAVEDSGF